MGYYPNFTVKGGGDLLNLKKKEVRGEDKKSKIHL
jgi:hypothetical protein